MSLTLHLLGAKVRMVQHTWFTDRASRIRIALIAAVGGLFVAAVYLGSHWFFAKCLTIEPIGEVVIRRILAMTLLAMLTLLSFSSLVDAFQTLYLAEDLDLLLPRPLPAESLYSARYVETAVHASWMLLPVAAPVFIAAGRLFHAGAAYYATITVVALALVVVAASAGVGTSLILTRLLPARRARLLLAVVGSLAAGLIALLIRSLRPEQFMNPDLRAPLLEALEALQGSDAAWLPSTWAMHSLWPHLGASGTTSGHPLLLLVTSAASSFFVVGWLFRWLHAPAFSKAQEGNTRAHSPLSASVVHGRPLKELVARALRQSGRRRFTTELRAKDRRVFVRDMAQWSQLLILAAIGALYVLNFRYIRAVSGTGLLPDIGLHFLNLSLTGFVSLALATRFVFPAVSLEGPAFWMVRAAPVSVADFLRAKTSSLAPALVVFANLLMVTTHLSLGAARVLIAAAVITVTPLTIGLVRLGIGLGARHPRFRSDNATAIATGIGGLIFMLSGTAVLVTVVLLSTLPTVMIVRTLAGENPPSVGWWITAAVMGLATLVIPLVTGAWAQRVGAKHLEGLERI